MDSNYILPRFYRRFAWLYFFLAVILLFFIFYLIWANVTIIITPAQGKVSHEFVVDVKESSSITALKPDDFVNGKIRQFEVEGTQIFPATGSKAMTSDVVGEVTIINNYSKEQTLVATTRLAALEKPDTVLVRLKKTVVVPAGGQIKVQVYPEKVDEFTTLPPMRFIIPGLWGPLQDKIYAENENALGEGNQTISFVTAKDLEQAQKSLKEKLFQQAISEFNQQLQPPDTLWPKLVSADISEINFDVQEGEEVAEFSATMKLKAVVVVFDESQVFSLAREKIKNSLTSDQQLVNLNPKSLSYLVDHYDLDNKVANVKVYVEGSSVLGESSKLLDKSNLLGKTVDEIKSYFSQYPEVQSVEVIFSPPWLQKMPRIKDKITIEIKK